MRDFFFHVRFFILFLFLEFLSIFFIFFDNSKIFSSFGASNFPIGTVYDSIHNLKFYFLLDKENKKLVDENIKLYNEKIKFKKIINKYEINKNNYTQKYIFTHTRIINNSINKQDNYLTIDKGILDGVMPDMGLILPNGVAGVIIHSTPHFSTVISLLNSKLRINARLKKNNYFGTLNWNGIDYNYIILYDIPRHCIINKGDVVETDGKSFIFPEGIQIGKVYSYSLDEERANYVIKVKLNSNFANLDYAYVVKNFMKKELELNKDEEIKYDKCKNKIKK